MSDFFFELSEILKYYLANRYGTSANAETSTELLHEMEQFQPDGLSLVDLRSFVESTDLIKYARFESTQEEAQNGLDICRNIVLSTRRSEEELKVLEEAQSVFELQDAPLRIRLAAILADLFLATGAAIMPLVIPTGLLPWGNLALSVAVMTGLMLLRDLAGRSPGHLLMGLQTVRVEGEPISFISRIKRNLLVAIPLIGWTAELLWAILDPRDRRPGDRWTFTGCQVIHAPSAPPALVGGLSFVLFFGLLAYWLTLFVHILGGVLS